MSYILNALKKAENKSFDGENLKIKKQILVLKRRSRGGKLKILFLITLLLGALLLGGWLGYMQKHQPENRTDVTKKHYTPDSEKIAPSHNKFDLVKDAQLPSAKKAVIPPSDILRNGIDDKNITKAGNRIDEINPPIPARRIKNPVKMQPAEAIQQTSEQEIKKDIEMTPQNYSDLPFLVKQKLPILKISLHYYNLNPARRLVRVNGKILHERDSVGDSLSVEEIKPTSTILNYDGYLFELNAPGS